MGERCWVLVGVCAWGASAVLLGLAQVRLESFLHPLRPFVWITNFPSQANVCSSILMSFVLLENSRKRALEEQSWSSCLQR